MDALYALDYPQKSHGMAMRKLNTDESILKRIENAARSVRLISESGLYRLVMRSDKPEAREFQDWVTRIVLPAPQGWWLHRRRGEGGGPEKLIVRKGIPERTVETRICFCPLGLTINIRTDIYSDIFHTDSPE